MKKIIKSLLEKSGYTVYKNGMDKIDHHASGYDLEKEAEAQIDVIKENTMLTYSRLVTLYQQVVYCETSGIEGGFVECGTWRGGAVGLMALGNIKHGTARRHLHLFDSFDSIPEPDRAVDGERAIQEVKATGGGIDGRLVPLRGIYAKVGEPDLQVNRKLLEETIGYDPNFLHYHKGWFQDTVPRDAPEIGDIAILRLDGDWYASTKVCLDNLYPHVVKGGIIVIDDYGWYDGCRKAVDEFLENNSVKAYLNHIDATGRYLIKP